MVRLPGQDILLNEKIDGDFPNHRPDPTVPENLDQPREIILVKGRDLGIAFDGGRQVMWKTGPSLIKTRMKELASPLAGEKSVHLFFADGYYGYDDAICAALRVLPILRFSDQTPAGLRDTLPPTPLRYGCPARRSASSRWSRKSGRGPLPKGRSGRDRRRTRARGRRVVAATGVQHPGYPGAALRDAG